MTEAEQVRVDLARALGWHNIGHYSPYGNLTGCRRGVFSLVPMHLPDWPANPEHLSRLEEYIGRLGLLDAYRDAIRRADPDAPADLASIDPVLRCRAATEVMGARVESEATA